MPPMSKYAANGTLKLDTATYEKELFRLQAELVTMQQWVIETGHRPVSYTHLNRSLAPDAARPMPA